MTSDPIFELRRVSKRFKHVQALDRVDLKVQRGRIVGLLGSNGAGKSTLLRHVVGLYLPDEGQCITLGRQASKLGPAELARIGYVHQEGELIGWMTVRQLIRYVSTYYDTWDHELEDRYIKEFDIPLKARVGSLSPGARQRLAILLAVCFDPELLLLDEPAAALDPLARAQFLNLILQMIQDDQERTIVISSHILSDVEKVVDHVVIMDKGRIICDAGLDDLRERYLRLCMTSVSGTLPGSIPLPNVIESRRDSNMIVAVVRDLSTEQIEAAAAAITTAVFLTVILSCMIATSVLLATFMPDVNLGLWTLVYKRLDHRILYWPVMAVPFRYTVMLYRKTSINAVVFGLIFLIWLATCLFCLCVWEWAKPVTFHQVLASVSAIYWLVLIGLVSRIAKCWDLVRQ